MAKARRALKTVEKKDGAAALYLCVATGESAECSMEGEGIWTRIRICPFTNETFSKLLFVDKWVTQKGPVY